MRERDYRQIVIHDWVRRTFGNATRSERATRLLEEAVELAQSEEVPKEMLHTLIEHVYSKESGFAYQEVGGVSTCLLAYCECVGLSADECEEREIQRILTLPEAHFRARQNVKAAAGVGLPVPQGSDE